MFRARDQIESLPTRAAVQVALLLTDGIHNWPPGSSPLETLPDLQEGGIRVYALGVGAPGAVDMPALSALATGTGGRSYAVGDNQPSLIETKMVEINAEVRGGIITTEPILFPDSRSSAVDKVIGKPERPVPPRRRPPLKQLLEALRVPDAEHLLPGHAGPPSNRAVAIPVVRRAGRGPRQLHGHPSRERGCLALSPGPERRRRGHHAWRYRDAGGERRAA